MNLPTKDIELKSGIVIVDDDPYYFVDQVNGIDGSLIVAYSLSKKSIELYKQNHNPRVLKKAGRINIGTIKKFSDSDNASPLSKHLSKRKGNTKKVTKVEYNPAVFVSYVTQGIDSITNTFGDGFPEMQKTAIRGPVNGHYQAMKPTGVFIGLNNVKWIKDVYDFSQWQGYLTPIYQHYLPYFQLVKEGLIHG